MARRGLLDVPRHESGHSRTGRALRVDQQPHLVSPPMAAAAAIAGHLVDVREFN